MGTRTHTDCTSVSASDLLPTPLELRSASEPFKGTNPPGLRPSRSRLSTEGATHGGRSIPTRSRLLGWWGQAQRPTGRRGDTDPLPPPPRGAACRRQPRPLPAAQPTPGAPPLPGVSRFTGPVLSAPSHSVQPGPAPSGRIATAAAPQKGAPGGEMLKRRCTAAPRLKDAQGRSGPARRGRAGCTGDLRSAVRGGSPSADPAEPPLPPGPDPAAPCPPPPGRGPSAHPAPRTTNPSSPRAAAVRTPARRRPAARREL